MTDDELTDFIRDNRIDFYCGSDPEAERETRILEAIESGAVDRKKPGRKPELERVDKYRVLRRELFGKERFSNSLGARMRFLKVAKKRFKVDRRTAENNWSRLWREDAK